MLNSDPFTRGKINTGEACTFLKPSGGVCIEISHESPFCATRSCPEDCKVMCAPWVLGPGGPGSWVAV
jgi:hypothetical protein